MSQPNEMGMVMTAAFESLTALDVEINPALDPRLQRLVLCRRQGIRKLATSSTGEDEVAVIAKVTDLAAWEELSEVRLGAVIASPDGTGHRLVTGRIPVARIESVRLQPFVKSLKAAQRLTLALHKTIAETAARVDLLPAGQLADGGRGVVVGIVDFGCDFAHRNFRHAAGGTRLLAIWDQNGPPNAASPFGYGTLHSQTDIDAALQKPDPYAALGYGPELDTPFQRGTHGTHVMDIAAGNGGGSGTPGVAPNADLIFVELAASDVPWSGPEVVEKSFGDSVQLLEAISFIFEQAGPRPCVVNVSLGTNGGPHDGTTLAEQWMDSLIAQASNRAVVIAASNSFADGIHAAGRVPADGHVDLVWQLPPNDPTHNELELWYAGADRCAVELIAPNGDILIRVEPGESRALGSPDHGIAVLVANRLDDPNNQDNVIGIFLAGGLQAGRWTVRLHGLTVPDGRFHAWVERDDQRQANFPPPHDNTHTIGSISCGRHTVVVGSYDAHKTTVPLSFFSSAGPTRDGREKPEVSAPGHDVLAAHSRTGNLVTRKSGTSMAAPAVTGITALVLAEAAARGVSLNSDQIRDILLRAARRDPPAGTDWHPQYGRGRLSAANAVAQVMAPASAPPPPIAALTAGTGKKARPTGKAAAKRTRKAVKKRP